MESFPEATGSREAQRQRVPRSNMVFFRKRHLGTQKSAVFWGPQNHHHLLFPAGSKKAARRLSVVIWTTNTEGLVSSPCLG